jgi:hypothetical protein
MDFNTSVAPPSTQGYQITPVQSQNPLETLAQMQEMRARGQQMQAVGMENQQRALDLQDQQIGRQAYMDSGGDMNKYQQLLMQRGVSPKMAMQTQQQLLTTRKTLAETGKAELENNQARHDQARGELTALEGLPDAQKAAQYPAVMQSLNQRGLLNDQEYKDWIQQNPSYPGSDVMKLGINHLATGSQLTKEELERREAEKNTAEAGKANVETDLLKHKTDLYNTLKATPQALAQRVAGSIDPQKYPQEYARALNEAQNAPDLEGINAAIKTHSENVSHREGTIATETDPAVLKAHTDQAVNTEKALSPLRTAQAVNTEKALLPMRVQQQLDIEMGKAKLAPDSFNSIIDPRARAAAESDYAKDSKEYADKVSAALQLKDFVTAAQGGNKAAPGLIPIAEVRQLLNRVNRQELQGVSSSAGNAFDRVQGFLGKWTEGQPIPPAVLKDTLAISDVMQNAARRGYEFKVQVNNKTHGGNVKPIDLTSAAAATDPKVKAYADEYFGGDVAKAQAAIAAQRAGK